MPADYPLGRVENDVFGTPDAPKSYFSYPMCNGSVTILSDGRKENPWRMPNLLDNGVNISKSAIVMTIAMIPNRVMQVDAKSQSLTVMVQVVLVSKL